MEPEIWKLIGVLVTILIFGCGTLIAAFRSVYKTMEAGDDALHERVNRVRDEYVRRVDLDTHMARIEATLKEMRDEQRTLAREMLTMLSKGGQQ